MVPLTRSNLRPIRRSRCRLRIRNCGGPTATAINRSISVEVELRQGDHVLDQRDYAIGLRTIELRRQLDRWGHSFTFVVNGVPIFAKGSNWIPSDSFPTRITRAHAGIPHRFGGAGAITTCCACGAAATTKTRRFYDLCDRYGMLVWQDFMYACAGYPLNDEAFLANVKIEVGTERAAPAPSRLPRVVVRQQRDGKRLGRRGTGTRPPTPI